MKMLITICLMILIAVGIFNIQKPTVDKFKELYFIEQLVK